MKTNCQISELPQNNYLWVIRSPPSVVQMTCFLIISQLCPRDFSEPANWRETGKAVNNISIRILSHPPPPQKKKNHPVLLIL